MTDDTRWDHALKVTSDGEGLAGQAGAVLLRKLADQVGLTAALGSALARAGKFQFTGQPAPYVGDVVLAGMRLADAVVVLSTPDDLVRLRSDLLKEEDPANERKIVGQARPNVIYEAGIADALDRTRTVLVEVGAVKSLSDLSGRSVIHFDGQAGSRHKLVNRLRKAGLQVNMTGEDWLETGDFTPSIDAARMSLAAALRPETEVPGS